MGERYVDVGKVRSRSGAPRTGARALRPLAVFGARPGRPLRRAPVDCGVRWALRAGSGAEAARSRRRGCGGGCRGAGRLRVAVGVDGPPRQDSVVKWCCAVEKGGSHALLRRSAVLGAAGIGVILRFCDEGRAGVGAKSAWEPPFPVKFSGQGRHSGAPDGVGEQTEQTEETARPLNRSRRGIRPISAKGAGRRDRGGAPPGWRGRRPARLRRARCCSCPGTPASARSGRGRRGRPGRPTSP